MAEARIPVDVFNPGQVFACLGLMEMAEILFGEVVGRFDSERGEFMINVKGVGHPIEGILNFLCVARLVSIVPAKCDYLEKEIENKQSSKDIIVYDKYPGPCEERMSINSLPILLSGKWGEKDIEIVLDHWIDLRIARQNEEKRMKLYSGNRSALKISKTMCHGDKNKKIPGFCDIIHDRKINFLSDPFGVLSMMGGSFNFDARGAWGAIDVGFSPNEHDMKVYSSPFVEFMSIVGLQYSRPLISRGYIMYAIWEDELPTCLARAVLGGAPIGHRKCYKFALGTSGKNKITTFAQEGPCDDTT